MQRRTFVVAGLLSSTFLSPSFAQQAVTVIYVGGWDCSFCRAWKNKFKADWLASKERGKVNYVEIDVPKLKDAYEERNWPKEYRAIREQLPSKFGTPRFIVAQNGKILSNETGSGEWDRTIAKIRELVG
jgi:hypothetical protein